MDQSFSKQGTWALAQALAQCFEDSAKLRRKSVRVGPLRRRLVDRKLNKSVALEDKIAPILAYRYRGVLGEIFREASSEQAGSSDASELAEFEGEIWQICSVGLNPQNRGHDFSVAMWRQTVRSCSALLQAVSLPRINQFKPKFMLRQFIDELPDCDERGRLHMVFEVVKIPLASQAAVTRLLVPAYRRLHSEVVKHFARLSELTDGAIAPAMFEQGQEPELLYDRWLLVD